MNDNAQRNLIVIGGIILFFAFIVWVIIVQLSTVNELPGPSPQTTQMVIEDKGFGDSAGFYVLGSVMTNPNTIKSITFYLSPFSDQGSPSAIAIQKNLTIGHRYNCLVTYDYYVPGSSGLFPAATPGMGWRIRSCEEVL